MWDKRPKAKKARRFTPADFELAEDGSHCTCPAGKRLYGNLRHNQRLSRFTLRGRSKVDGQWKLFCMMHNIEKLAHHGYAH